MNAKRTSSYLRPNDQVRQSSKRKREPDDEDSDDPGKRGRLDLVGVVAVSSVGLNAASRTAVTAPRHPADVQPSDGQARSGGGFSELGRSRYDADGPSGNPAGATMSPAVPPTAIGPRTPIGLMVTDDGPTTVVRLDGSRRYKKRRAAKTAAYEIFWRPEYCGSAGPVPSEWYRIAVVHRPPPGTRHKDVTISFPIPKPNSFGSLVCIYRFFSRTKIK